MSAALAAAGLMMAFGYSVACDLPPGAVVGRVLMSVGNGNGITFAVKGGDTADFRLRPSGVIVVGPNGISPANCGTNQSLTITATQQ
jgi:hypothetical protein